MIYLHHDEFNAIAIIPDNHHGVVVQLVTYISRMLPNNSNELEQHNSSFVEYSAKINIRDQAGNINNKFKVELKEAVVVCQHQLVIIQQNREHIQGALKDYVSTTTRT